MTETLTYLPLGGAGEIGMNMYAYGFGAKGKERYIVIDAGVAFPNNDTSPGVDLIFADPAFLIAKRDRVDAIFITHAHEDHVGALGLLVKELGDVPIYARKFTAEIARNKMERYAQNPKQIVVLGVDTPIDVGPFNVSFQPISHSIPEASALHIKVGGKSILHTGDFKVDRSPLVGEAFDDDRFQKMAPLDYLVCDSTNVFSEHEGRSEAELVDNLHGLIANAKGLVCATTFASNVARVRTLAQAATRAGRQVVLVGRSMNTMVSNAHKTRVLENMPPVLAPEDYDPAKRNSTMIIATGSQGEYRAATGWLSRGGFMGIKLQEDDLYIFSSKTIPGNERSVAVVLNDLAKQGVDVVINDDRYHVSGHANQPDLMHLQEITKANAVIPMHGEYRHLRRLAKLSKEAGREAVIAPNGTMVELTLEGGLRQIDEVETGRRFVDGRVVIGAMDGIVRERLQMADRGMISILATIEANGQSYEAAWAILSGLSDKSDDGLDVSALIEQDIDDAIAKLKASQRADDDQIEAVIVKQVKRSASELLGKKPIVKVFISRFDE